MNVSTKTRLLSGCGFTTSWLMLRCGSIRCCITKISHITGTFNARIVVSVQVTLHPIFFYFNFSGS